MADMYRSGCYGSLSISTADRDFQEDEVWGSAYDQSHSERCYPNRRKTPSGSSLSRMFGKDKNKSNLSKAAPNSVPVSIPASCNDAHWSKVNGHRSLLTNSKKSVDEENEDDEGCEIYELPPHEWLEGKHSRREMWSFSVVEGAGRTLKGRDLSKVRDSVLTRTGFLE